MSEQQTTYVGSGKIVTTQYGDLIKMSFSAKDLQQMLSYAAANNGWVNCVMKEKMTQVQGKPTHSISIDTWKPKGGYSQRQSNPPPSGNVDDEEPPF